MFERQIFLFDAKRPYGTWGISDTFIDGPEEIQDIFYLIQCILPGILTITREEDIDDGPEFFNARGLPRLQWLERNSSMLKLVFDDVGYDALWEAAANKNKAWKCWKIYRDWGL